MKPLDEISVISDVGIVLDSSFVLRNNGKKLVYFSTKFFLERIWFHYVTKKSFFSYIHNLSLSDFFDLNFVTFYNKFDWSFVKNKFFFFKVKYNYIFNVKNYISNIFFNNSNIFFNNKHPLLILAKKKKIKNLLFFNKFFIKNNQKFSNLKRKLSKIFWLKKKNLNLEKINFFSKFKSNEYKFNLKLRKKIFLILNKIFFLSLYLRINILNLFFNIILKIKNKFKFIFFKIISFLLIIKKSYNKKLYNKFIYNKLKNKILFFNLLYKFIILINKYKHKKLIKKNHFFLLSKFLHKWFLKKKDNKKKIIKKKFKFNSFLLINRVSRFYIFKKFRLKFKKKKFFFKFKKWKKKNFFFYKKRKLIKSKYCWGHVGRLYKFNDNRRLKHYIFNVKYDLSNIGLQYFSKNKLFNNYFFLYKFKNVMNLILLNLSLIINFLLRKCVFKLFLGFTNSLAFYDFKLLLYKLIFLFYNKRNFLLKNKKKKIKKYFFRSVSLNLYYLI